ncbi:uncharacterized abhydrolase domain-containing protein DDB_G0269086 [Cyclospora cayetanensis]|uniref:Uncharacterized abhydrolase domain-containing protein DDB_G0269086 n=1 Tax=Cyclospora cayetanensis TaxID=88456 RepID=A0A6P6S2N8_9EIME|nr:uncharacterized abhydrolase domain-containing protein DDB_G0269086 [Cyclospora cayetanensis]
MSLKTPALPRDFCNFGGWYGLLPSFSSAQEEGFSLSCLDEWFGWRLAGINAFWLPRIHHATHDISGVWMRGLDRLLQCRAAASAAPADRPRLLQQMFREQHPLNDESALGLRSKVPMSSCMVVKGMSRTCSGGVNSSNSTTNSSKGNSSPMKQAEDLEELLLAAAGISLGSFADSGGSSSSSSTGAKQQELIPWAELSHMLEQWGEFRQEQQRLCAQLQQLQQQRLLFEAAPLAVFAAEEEAAEAAAAEAAAAEAARIEALSERNPLEALELLGTVLQQQAHRKGLLQKQHREPCSSKVLKAAVAASPDSLDCMLLYFDDQIEAAKRAAAAAAASFCSSNCIRSAMRLQVLATAAAQSLFPRRCSAVAATAAARRKKKSKQKRANAAAEQPDGEPCRVGHPAVQQQRELNVEEAAAAAEDAADLQQITAACSSLLKAARAYAAFAAAAAEGSSCEEGHSSPKLDAEAFQSAVEALPSLDAATAILQKVAAAAGGTTAADDRGDSNTRNAAVATAGA